MYKYIIAAFLFWSLALSSFAQNKYAAMINSRAELYAISLKKHNFKGVANLTYPKYISLIKKDTLLSRVSDNMVTLKKEGLRYKSIIFNEPKVLFSFDKIMYCIVPQKIIKYNSQGEFRINTFLLAISDDFGKTWYFLNEKQFVESQKTLFPIMHKDIVFPRTSSTFVRNKKFNSFDKPN
jgi:hypothetical protein